MPGLFTLKRLFAVLLLLAASVLLAQLVGELNRVKTLKTDLAEIHHVRYGLLDADQWVGRISAIIEQRVSAFELTDANRPQIVRAVEQVLDTLLVEIERYLRQRNLKGGGTWMDQLQGALQQGLQDVLIDFDKLRKKVPRYAEAVVEQLGTPEAKEEIKNQILTLMRRTSDSTFAKVDRSPLERLFERHACVDAGHCAQRLQDQIDAAWTPTRQRLGILVGLVGLMFLLCLSGSSRRDRGDKGGLDPFRLFLLTGATLILLLGGLLTPMIEIEARISELTLVFMNEPIVFSDQVLYFQSKSLLEVVRILATTGAADMLLVALLITLFSIIFPALKLIATYLYYFDIRRARDSASIRFFALRSGKWSMADVLVIALFMAYIGFDGLVESQLGRLWSGGAEAPARLGATVLTTNGTSLEPGFYLFLAFVLASLLLSARLEKAFAESHPN
ncbi:paraquat-inducible protein A [Thiocystis violacea]|uniref:paraquat-inducible protein A n=1 Tax=Thiocystis violacea TaxID=13725 RepID=UPI00190324B2|nr:paraquat-inducible protein A [Thiocystis violacea]MBK1719662.1 paraquat-inducible protein A [Thiocystis violacea]